MSALIRKSNIRKANSNIFKGRSAEKKEILGDVKTSGISERKLGLLLKREYGYKPDRRKRIISSITGSDKKKDEPQEMTWTQKMRQKEQERKLERKELEKQRKLEAIDEEKRAERARISGKIARREESSRGSRMNFIGMQKSKKEISNNKKGSGFAGNLANSSSGANANQGSKSGFAGGGPSQNRDDFFHQR